MDDPGFEPRSGQEIFHFFKTSRPPLESNQLPIWWIQCFFPRCKSVGAWCWPPPSSSAEIKSKWSYTSTPLLICLHGLERNIFTSFKNKNYKTSWDACLASTSYTCAEVFLYVVIFWVTLTKEENVLNYFKCISKYFNYYFF